MIRVNEDYPCLVCGKTDWCLRDQEGRVGICQRIHSEKQINDAGWLHILPKDMRGKRIPNVKVYKDKTCPINWEGLQKLYRSNMLEFDDYGANVFGIGSDGESITYPMYDGARNMIGMQRIFPDGEKRFVKGSKNGIFYPAQWKHQEEEVFMVSPYVFVCEGIKDAITVWNLGYYSLARASCATGIEYLVKALENCGKPIVIVADNDQPGIRGAKKLQLALMQSGKNLTVIIIPPGEGHDLTDWVEDGLTAEELNKIIKDTLDG